MKSTALAAIGHVVTRHIPSTEFPNLRDDYNMGDKVFEFVGDTRGVIKPSVWMAVVETPEQIKSGPFAILPKDALDLATV